MEDFIAVLPVYERNIDKRGGSDIGVEKKSGFQKQTNVYLAVPNDTNAMKAFTAAFEHGAFEHGVTDIIAFDCISGPLGLS